jgi:anhydro-N-acetylmuramic acid kinase
VNRFLSGAGLHAGLVASHGHTIFHQPGNQLTFQLGAGAALAAQCGITTVSDFRTTDVALGGQGAPLVPVGDELLFNNYTFCLNLGGFSNISNQQHGRRIACDLSPVNLVVNSLAMRAGYEYDNNGEMGSRGSINTGLVDRLNALGFYALPAPKSLGREWVETSFMPVLDQYDIPLEDLIRSVYEHIALQISRYINSFETGEVLVTGGGAFNTFLVDLIRQKSQSVLVIPGEQLIKFKEALIFAFLGLLRYRNEINCLSSVTGAIRNSSSGIIHMARA